MPDDLLHVTTLASLVDMLHTQLGPASQVLLAITPALGLASVQINFVASAAGAAELLLCAVRTAAERSEEDCCPCPACQEATQRLRAAVLALTPAANQERPS